MFVLSYCLIIIVCLFIEGFFACTEMAVISSNKLKLRYLASAGNKGARKLKQFLKTPQLFLSTTLVGVNIAIIVSSSVASRLLSYFVPDKLVNVCTTAVMLPIILFFGEIIPMTIGRLHALRISLVLIHPLKLAYYLLYPFVQSFSWISEKITALLKINITNKDYHLTREELLHVLEEETKDNILSDHDSGIIKRIFHFSRILIEQVMVPLSRTVMVNAESTCEDVIKTMQDSGFSRIPVYESSTDNIIGIIRPAELIQADLSKPVKKYLIKPYTVKQNTPVLRILWDLQMNGRQMVIVLGHGRAVGIATMEDIMEKVVGNITDEYDVIQRDNG